MDDFITSNTPPGGSPGGRLTGRGRAVIAAALGAVAAWLIDLTPALLAAISSS